MHPADDPNASRRLVYALLITLAVGSATGRVLSTQLVFEPSMYTAKTGRPWPTTRPEPPTPTFSSNDRSRWATVRALVDNGTYVVGSRDRNLALYAAPAALAAVDPLSLACLLDTGRRLRLRSDRGIIFHDGWKSVDKLMDPKTFEFYSTKPPLLSTMAAGEYSVLKRWFGWTLDDESPNYRPQEVVRTILMTFNVLPLVLYLWLLARLLDRQGASDWAGYFLVGTAAFGTLVTPFLITFSNHTLGTYSVLIALYAAMRILDGTDRAWLYLLAGFCTGFAVTNELPSAAFAAGLAVLLCWRSPRKALLWFTPAVALPVAALLWTNHLATGSWFELAYNNFNKEPYLFEGSHWLNVKMGLARGIDTAGKYENKLTYAFHLLVGHHGVFSLTPVFLLTVAGMAMGLFRRDLSLRETINRRMVFALIAVVSLVVIGYYIYKSDNYGGFSAGPRWLLWLAPLWLVTALPAVEWLGKRRWGRGVALVLLALSVLSASYPAWNPWRHPWIYNFLDSQGQIPY